MFNVKHHQPDRRLLSEKVEQIRECPPLCDYEDSTYRTDFWEGQEREYEDAVERLALKALLPPRGQRLLDVGAGFGRLASMYAGYEQVILLDYSRSQLEYARGRLGDDRFIYVAADIYRLPLVANAVDTAVMVRVLHHLANASLAFRQLERVTRPQGTLLLEFANKRHIKNVARYFLRQGVNPFDHQPHEFAELHYNFHPTWVDQQLREAGFGLEQQRSVSLFRANALKRFLPISLLVKLDGALQRITAPLAPGPSIFVRARTSRSGPLRLADPAHLFCCPGCGHEPLHRKEATLCCASCGTRWPIENGIYVFK